MRESQLLRIEAHEANTTQNRSTAALPSGDVTFLLTDIEGSTAILRSLGGDYMGLLRRHRELLADCAASHGGVLLDTVGDSCLLVFATAEAGFAAACLAQRALAAARWVGGVDLRVRMGLHRGSAVPVAGEYASLALHKAARIMALADGSEVCLSAAVADELLPRSQSQLEPIGARTIAGFARPAFVYRVSSENLLREDRSAELLSA